MTEAGDPPDKLARLQKTWDSLGKVDPLWAVLTDPRKRSGKWDVNSFFEAGEREISGIFEYVDSLGINPRRRTALDFGCGVGRLTQALAQHFEAVWGVDIAPSMIDLAKKYNRHGEKCTYLVNCAERLPMFLDDTFDFVYSSITLQHMDPALSVGYIREFVRVLAPGGVMIFQLPERQQEFPRDERFLPKALLGLYRRVRNRGLPVMEMHGRKREEVIALLEHCGALVRNVVEDHSAGTGWSSYRYCALKA